MKKFKLLFFTGKKYFLAGIAGVVLFLLFLMMTSCGERKNATVHRKQMTVDVFIVKPKPLSVVITSTGDLLPNEQVLLKAPVSGNVMEIHFDEGAFVKKGDLLIKIDDRAWKARQDGLKAQLVSARNELERNKELIKVEGASQESVDQAEATVQNLEAQINELQVSIDLANVRAPFSGQLGMRNFSPGAYLSQGETITTLAQLNPIKVNFTVPAKYANQMKEGQTVTITTPASGDTSFARIYAIDPVISAANRSLQIRAFLENPDRSFVPGDFAEVIISIDQSKNALMVPAESIIPELNTHVVYVIHHGTVRRQDVSIGIRTPSDVEILKGLTAGDTLLVTGLLEINDGDRVNIGKVKKEGAL